jgi:hypothetical protein
MEGHSRDADESDGSESHLLTYYLASTVRRVDLHRHLRLRMSVRM